MRFQSIQNNKIYRLYREDEMDRLTKKINQIKNRKNIHVGNSKQKHLLPYISAGYGFSLQRKRQIDKENGRLQDKIKKAKDTHSTYFVNQSQTIKSQHKLKKSEVKIIQSLTNRSMQKSLVFPNVPHSERKYLGPISTETATSGLHQKIRAKVQTAEGNSFRKQIMKIYNQSFSDRHKKIL